MAWQFWKGRNRMYIFYDCTKCKHYEVCKILETIESNKDFYEKLNSINKELKLPDGLELQLRCKHFVVDGGTLR